MFPTLWRLHDQPLALTFAPLAWLKLMFFAHAGETEIAGFGISAEKNLLYIEEFVTVKQYCTAVTFRLDEFAVADFIDICVDRGIRPHRCGRVLLHTHPMESPEPSGRDEEAFRREFGRCDWALMFIIGNTGRTYARLRFSAGPGGDVLLPVHIDWASLPQALSAKETSLDALVQQWHQEFTANIFIEPVYPSLAGPATVTTRLKEQAKEEKLFQAAQGAFANRTDEITDVELDEFCRQHSYLGDPYDVLDYL